jgi:chemotaxis protein CheC
MSVESLFEFEELELDAARELMNVSVGRACQSLSAITRKEVTLSIPELAFDHFDIAHLTHLDECVAVCQRFKGDMNGLTLLFFPREIADRLVDSFIDGVDISQEDRAVVERDAMLEIGNIILNATVGSIVNQLNCELDADFPSFHVGKSEKVISESGMVGTYSMTLRTLVEVAELDLGTHLTMVLDSDSYKKFHQMLNTYLYMVMNI